MARRTPEGITFFDPTTISEAFANAIDWDVVDDNLDEIAEILEDFN